LTFVVAVGAEVRDVEIVPGGLEDVFDDSVDIGITAAAAFVVKAAGVTDAGEDEAVFDSRQDRLVGGEPSDGADGARNPEEPVGEAVREGTEVLGEFSGDDHAGEVVVAEGGMAGVGGEEDFVVGSALDAELAVAEVAGLEGGINTDLKFVVGKGIELALGQTEAPSFLVVGGAIGDPIRRIREREEMFAEFGEAHFPANRSTIVKDVEAGLFEVKDGFSRGVFDEGIADVPLFRHDPIEDGCAGGDLVKREGDERLEEAKALPEAITRDAAANGVEGGDARIELFAVAGWVEASENVAELVQGNNPKAVSCPREVM
jgi:hypothetical protein